MASTRFGVAEFAQWNTTTSVVTLPSRITQGEQLTSTRLAFLKKLGPNKLCGIQILPKLQFRVEFKSVELRQAFDLNGFDFRGVHLTPSPAYEHLTQVFVEQAPLQFPNDVFRETLQPYGRVVSVKHLPVKGFPHVQSGTRMVSMTIHSPIPSFITVAGFRCMANYKGKIVTCFHCHLPGHTVQICPQRQEAATYAAITKLPAPPRTVVYAPRSASTTVRTPRPSRRVHSSSHGDLRVSTIMGISGTPSDNDGTQLSLSQSTSLPDLARTVNGHALSFPEVISSQPQGSLQSTSGSSSISSTSTSSSISELEQDTPDLPHLPPCDSLADTSLEAMAPKGSKRAYPRGPLSDEEDSKRPFLGPSIAGLKSASDIGDDLQSIPDTTIPVNIDPDGTLYSTTVDQSNSAETPAAPTTVYLVDPSYGFSEGSQAVTLSESSPNVKAPDGARPAASSTKPQRDSKSSGIIPGSPEEQHHASNDPVQVVLPASPVTSDGRTVIPESPLGVSTEEPVVRPHVGSIDIPLPLSDSECDIPGHEVWEEDGCSTPPSLRTSTGGAVCDSPLLFPDVDRSYDPSSSDSDDLSSSDEDVPRSEIEALLGVSSV